MTNTTSDIDKTAGAPFASIEPREWSRISRFDSNTVLPIRLLGGEFRDALLLDNSLGGLGLAVENADGFGVGTEISLVFNHAPMRAFVRQIRQLDDGWWKLGVQWKDE